MLGFVISVNLQDKPMEKVIIYLLPFILFKFTGSVICFYNDHYIEQNMEEA